MDVQRNLEANVEKRTKDTYGPPMGKRLLVFMDDMNMPQVDEYGTQQPIALLKLLLERGGMYDRGKELILKNFRDIGFVAAMGKVWFFKTAIQIHSIWENDSRPVTKDPRTSRTRRLWGVIKRRDFIFTGITYARFVLFLIGFWQVEKTSQKLSSLC